jgi:C_GCAxxG_C_C family probable redox protein
MPTDADNAVTIFAQGYNCAQAILLASGQRLGISRQQAIAIAGPFGHGMAGTGQTCGAVAGALMVIGLRYPAGGGSGGTGGADDVRIQRQRDRLARTFITRFKERNATISCPELLRGKGGGLAGLLHLHTGNKRTVCIQAVRDAAEILSELLADLPPDPSDHGHP